MKKVTLILGFGLLVITSCKKTWTCECDSVMPDGTTSKHKISIIDQKRSDAETICENNEHLMDAMTSPSGIASTCELN